MNSIHQQQQEDTHANLQDKKAVNKIKELAKNASTCFFCTSTGTAKPFQTRPMSVQDVDDEGNIWFLSAEDSSLNEQVIADNKVQLLFQGSAHSDFLAINGSASISKDKQKIKEFWGPLLKTWFTEGVDDPRITVIKVETGDGYYWDNKHGNAIAFAKMSLGAMLGKTMDDSIEGKLNP
ncbi:MAG: pyridoxamine 5'-phosphate oxidase family protein [Ferruginibacter sp.]